MVPWWKRLIYALLGMLIATTTYWTVMFCRELVRRPIDRASIGWAVLALLMTECMTLAICSFGYLLASPIVLTVSNFRGWRFWMYWFVGTCIGPLVTYLNSVYVTRTQPVPSQFKSASLPLAGLVAPTAIACATALIYLLLMRRAQARALKLCVEA